MRYKMNIIYKIKILDKTTSKYFPIFAILSYGLICGFMWPGNKFIWNSMIQDIIVGFVLLNQAVFISYLTFYKE